MIRAVWSNAVLGERRNWVIGWSAVLLSLFVLSVLFFRFIGAGQPSTQVIGSVIPLALLALFYWTCYVPGAVRQNSPANARLVPGLHRAVRRTTVLAWCLTLAPLALFSSAIEHGALMFAALSLMVTSIGMARGGSATGSSLFLLLTLAIGFVPARPAVVAWLSSAPVLAALYLFGAALAWQGLLSVFPFGGERHWKLLKGQAEQRNSTDLHKTMLLKRASGGRLRLYALLLRRDLRLSARPEHLLLHAIGPGNHRFDFVFYLLLVLLIGIVAKLVLVALGLGGSSVPLWFVVSFAVTLLPMQGPNFQRLVVSMRNTRGEQALVRLAPRAPRADLLGRALARQMLRVCLSEWLACGAGALALILLFGGGAKELGILATLQCATLAMAGWPLRDYSGKRRGALLLVITQAVLVAGLALTMYLLHEPLALRVALLGCALAIVYQRWKSMAGAAPPFPAAALA